MARITCLGGTRKVEEVVDRRTGCHGFRERGGEVVVGF